MTTEARILQARDGGYVVYMTDPKDEFYVDPLAFAGSLADCLAYLERTLGPQPVVVEPGPLNTDEDLSKWYLSKEPIPAGHEPPLDSSRLVVGRDNGKLRMWDPGNRRWVDQP